MTALARLRRRVGKGEMWALVAALGYALNHIFLRVALRGYDLHNTVGSTLQAMPTLLLTLVVGWGIRRRDRGHLPPWADRKLAAGLLGSGLLLFVVSVPMLFGAFRAGGVLITSRSLAPRCSGGRRWPRCCCGSRSPGPWLSACWSACWASRC